MTDEALRNVARESGVTFSDVADRLGIPDSLFPPVRCRGFGDRQRQQIATLIKVIAAEKKRGLS